MPAAPIFDADQPHRAAPPNVVVRTHSPLWQTWASRLVSFCLVFLALMIYGAYIAYHDYYSREDPPIEKFYSGDKFADDKIVLLKMNGTIMPPFTERLIHQIKHAAKASDVKGVLLEVDSPGGFVADSHEIYHELKKLSAKKTVWVQMKRMAASGGYYISMGVGPKGKLFAEPTTWTGSIGVIIPRYDISKLAEKVGIESEPLKTGEFKDALSPFRPLTEPERKLWENILNQSFEQFVSIIDENRDNLNAEQIKELATGQVYTAQDALKNGLVDEIGFEEDSLDKLKGQLGIKAARVVTYEHTATLTDMLIGNSKARAAPDTMRLLLESSVPRALFYFSWLPPLPAE